MWSSEQNKSRPNPRASPSFRSMILQDFLAAAPSEAAVNSPGSAGEDGQPPTALTLNSGMDFSYMGAGSNMMQRAAAFPTSNPKDDGNGQTYSVPFVTPSFSDAIIGSPPPPGLFSFCPEGPALDGPDAGGGNIRHKRMIKNRLSAARSRARKQAYTNELELEIACLVDENAKLRRQSEELRVAMAAQLQSKNALQRTFTAPF